MYDVCIPFKIKNNILKNYNKKYTQDEKLYLIKKVTFLVIVEVGWDFNVCLKFANFCGSRGIFQTFGYLNIR